MISIVKNQTFITKHTSKLGYVIGKLTEGNMDNQAIRYDFVRKVYFKEGGKLQSTRLTGFSGDDLLDTSAEYMDVAKVMVGGLGVNMACLTVIDGGINHE